VDPKRADVADIDLHLFAALASTAGIGNAMLSPVKYRFQWRIQRPGPA